MAKQLNFNTLKKEYFTVTLTDKTVLMIGTPTKSVMNALILLQASVEALDDDHTNQEIVEDLYEACAKVMSRNKAGIEITAEYLAKMFDIQDIMIFFNGYMEFLNEVTGSKN